jgi:hypothetical protein
MANKKREEYQEELRREKEEVVQQLSDITLPIEI